MNDPLTRRTAAMIAVVAATGAAAWATWRWAMHPAAVAVPPAVVASADAGGEGAPDLAAASASDPSTAIDLAAAFEVDLWNTDVAAATAAEARTAAPLARPEAAPAPPPRPSLTLLAITRQDAALHASVYDAAADAILVATAGTSIAGYAVESVDERSVALRRGADRWVLALDDGSQAQAAAAAAGPTRRRATPPSMRRSGRP